MWGNGNEQIQSALKDLSINSSYYYDQLKEKGFSHEDAIAMVIEWQKAMMGVGVRQ